MFKLPEYVTGKRLQEFGSSLVFQVGLPLIPIILELWQTGTVKSSSMVLVAALYPVTVAVTSSNRLSFSLAVFASILFSAAYGQLLDGKGGPPGVFGASLAAIGFFVAAHAMERWRKHVVDGTEYWEPAQP
jgi:asparagine N-glycosylation enzyme membrane subunit Stt3